MSDVDFDQIFPSVSTASKEGMLLIGGELTPEWLIAAYRRGIFPWPICEGKREILAWWSPDPRAILPLDEFHISKRLKRRIRSGRFRITCNRDFAGVIAACAEPRDYEPETWITADIKAAYQKLHHLGHAHSVESWLGEELVGGVYGVALGGMFAGESMFHRVTDASKVALAYLVQHLRARGYILFDIQQQTRHAESLGAKLISRSEFLTQLQEAIATPASFGSQLHYVDPLFAPRSSQ